MPTTKAGKRLFPGLNLWQEHAVATREDIDAIEAEAYANGHADGSQFAEVTTARLVAIEKMRIKAAVKTLGDGQTRIDQLTGYMGWDYQKAIAAVLHMIDGDHKETYQDVVRSNNPVYYSTDSPDFMESNICPICHNMIVKEAHGGEHPSAGDHDSGLHVMDTYKE